MKTSPTSGCWTASRRNTRRLSFVRNAGYSVIHYVSSQNMTNPTEITTDSLRKAVAAGALRLLTLVTNGVHGDGWAEAWFHPFLVPWVFSKSKVNGQTVFTWPAPGPASVSAVFNERQVSSSSPENLRVANGIIRWNGVSRCVIYYIFHGGDLLRKRHLFTADNRHWGPRGQQGIFPEEQGQESVFFMRLAFSSAV